MAENRARSPSSLSFGVYNLLDNLLTRIPVQNEFDSSPTTQENEARSAEVVNNEVAAGGFRDSMFLYLSEREKDEFRCSICFFVMKDVYQCRNEHRFCYGCIYTWSSGSNQSHEKCPMCRTDGLYAPHAKLNERILRKCVTCEQEGCNWLGCLKDYEKHEHRYYTPSEFQVLTSFRTKHQLGRSDEKDSATAAMRALPNANPATGKSTGRLLPQRLQETPTQVTAPDQLTLPALTEPAELTYRRLVPTSRILAYEQLRQTREQLAAMLTLMTMELEERRSQVLVAASQARSAELMEQSVRLRRRSSPPVAPSAATPSQASLQSSQECEPVPQRPRRLFARLGAGVGDTASPSMTQARSNVFSGLQEQLQDAPERGRRRISLANLYDTRNGYTSTASARLRFRAPSPHPIDANNENQINYAYDSDDGRITPPL